MTLPSEFATRNNVVLRRAIKRLQATGLILWVRQHSRCGHVVTIEDCTEQAMTIALKSGLKTFGKLVF